MKNLIFILIAFCLSMINVEAQGLNIGLPTRITASEADTNKNGETDYWRIPNSGGFKKSVDLTFQTLCTDAYGGTSDGAITIEGSTDGTNYVPITDEVYTDVSDDSLTIVGAAVLEINIPKTHHYVYRVKIVGTSGDTTRFTPYYRYQEVKY